MPRASDITEDSRFLGLFVGRSGHGKSVAAYSFPQPLHVFDLDGRIRGGLAPWIDRKGISYTSFPPKVGLGAGAKTVFERLNNEFETLLIQCQTNSCPYRTLVVDSITFEAIALLLDSIPLTHMDNKGRTLGSMMLAGPEDYKFQSTGTQQVLAFLRSLPLNVIVTAHIVNRYARPAGDSQFSEAVIVGEQLNLTDKLAEAVPAMFDHVFKFTKTTNGNNVQFWVNAHSDLARTTYNIPTGDQEITKKNFSEYLSKFKQVPSEVLTKA